MNIIGAGGESLNWFYRVFCNDMSRETFFEEYLPGVLENYTGTYTDGTKSDAGAGAAAGTGVAGAASGAAFLPYLAGDRNSIIDKQAVFSGLTLDTTREQMLYAVVRGLISQLWDGMDVYRKISRLSDKIYYTGGGSSALRRYKEKVFSDFSFEMVDNCAMKGIAKLTGMAAGLK